MKKQYYGTRKPERDFPDVEQLQGAELFYFNLALAVKYGLYSRANDRHLPEGWVRDGLTDEQIAENIGISVRTLYRWKNQNKTVRFVMT